MSAEQLEDDFFAGINRSLVEDPEPRANYVGQCPVWLVPSKSEPGVVRIVIQIGEGWACSCPAANECWHIKQACRDQEARALV